MKIKFFNKTQKDKAKSASSSIDLDSRGGIFQLYSHLLMNEHIEYLLSFDENI